jgi:hypothetical protein
MKRSTHVLLSASVNAILRGIAAKYENVKTLDLTDFLCTQDVCAGRVNNIIAYTDYEHLSITTMSRALLDRLTLYFD